MLLENRPGQILAKNQNYQIRTIKIETILKIRASKIRNLEESDSVDDAWLKFSTTN